jgi:fatty-acyl-CoA synthase
MLTAAGTGDCPTPLEMFGAETIGSVVRNFERSDRGVTLIDRNLAEERISYVDLLHEADTAGRNLYACGLRPGARVGIVSPTSRRFLSSLFGAWLVGAVPIIMPLPHRASEVAATVAEVRRRLDFVGATQVIVADEIAMVGTGKFGAKVLTCSELGEKRAHFELGGKVSNPDDLAYLQFSSGTTSQPKAIKLTHRQILTNIAASWCHTGLDVQDNVHVSWLPFFHDMGLSAALSHILTQGHLVLEPPEEYVARPDSWVNALSKYQATSTAAPDFAYGLAARGMRMNPRPLDLASLRVCGDGAESIRVGNLRAFTVEGSRYGLRSEAMCPMYGLAEATVAVAITPTSSPIRTESVSRKSLEYDRYAELVAAGTDDARELVVCGIAIPGVSLRVVGPKEEPLGYRKVGELHVRGQSVMDGYWGDPEATAAAMTADGWLRTGDLAYLTDQDELVICGRIKDMIIVGGRNLYPEEYESIAREVAGNNRICAAFADEATERMVVVVEMEEHDPTDRTREQIVELSRRRLDRAPNEVTFVKKSAIPRTSSGKVQRSACRVLYNKSLLPRIEVRP